MLRVKFGLVLEAAEYFALRCEGMLYLPFNHSSRLKGCCNIQLKSGTTYNDEYGGASLVIENLEYF